ncbi:MAG: ABC transporter permease [Actinomyces sp.]|nr:MAG: ABC transporter permease [Actinomyces sp.]
MRDVLDLLGVAIGGLTSRPTRTLLIMLGPVIGVAAIVAAVGLTESAKGDLKARLDELGTDLLVAHAEGTFGTADPTFPADVIERVEALPGVADAAAVTEVPGVVTAPYEAAADEYRAFPIPVLAADTDLPGVLEVPLRWGRWLDPFDRSHTTRAAVIGWRLADRFGVLRGEPRTIRLGDVDYGVVGVLDRVLLEDAFDSAVFITPEAAVRDFDAPDAPDEVYVRAAPGRARAVGDALPVAINLGGPDEVSVEVPTDALEASAQADTTLQAIVALMGALALVVGGVGIANVMSISVIQRSAEIGIRRALGHSRRVVALQFLLEAAAVGLLGGMVGAGAGAVVVAYAARVKGWIVVLDPALLAAGTAAAVLVSMVAGLYPSAKAARLEPLETLRLG